MGRTFWENLEIGNRNQNIAINYLVKEMGFELIGGDINGKTIGISEIEEICNCNYIPIDVGKHGAMLEFTKRNGNKIAIVMPDELLLKKKSGKFRWMEVKSTDKIIFEYLTIPVDRIDDYNRIEEYSGIPVFIVFVVPSTHGWNGTNLFYTTPKEIISGKNDAFEKNYKDYKIYVDRLETINKEPFSSDGYK